MDNSRSCSYRWIIISAHKHRSEGLADDKTRMQFATALASRAEELGLQYFRRLDTLTIEASQG